VPVAPAIPEGVDVFHTDCTAASLAEPADDVGAITSGYASQSDVPPG
jgi:hypothetical protein